MKKGDRTYSMYLDDMILSMSRISVYIEGYSFESFRDDPKTVDAVIRNFEIIGEASKNLPNSLKEKYPNVPWKEMYILRNRVSHEYFGVDYGIIWNIATQYLPKNLLQIQEILRKES